MLLTQTSDHEGRGKFTITQDVKKGICCRGVLLQYSSSCPNVPDENKARVEAVFEFAFLDLRRPTNIAEE